MNQKLVKVLDQIQKAEKRIAEWQEQLECLEQRKKQLEDEEILKGIRSMDLESRELLALLDGIQKGTASIQYRGKEPATPDGEKGPEEEAHKEEAPEREEEDHEEKH